MALWLSAAVGAAVVVAAAAILARVAAWWQLRSLCSAVDGAAPDLLASAREAAAASRLHGGRVLCLVNPIGGARSAEHAMTQLIRPLLDRLGARVEVVTTLARGHARSVVAAGARDARALVVMGGDGLLHEALNGLRDSQREASAGKGEGAVRLQPPVLLVPCGSSNGPGL